MSTSDLDLPDIETLTRLANEYFKADSVAAQAPVTHDSGQVVGQASSTVDEATSVADQMTALGATSPASPPSPDIGRTMPSPAVPGGALPSTAARSSTVSGGAVPSIRTASSPDAISPATAATAATAAAQAMAPGLEFPGEAELRALLAPRATPSPSVMPPPSAMSRSSAMPSFYFEDYARFAQPSLYLPGHEVDPVPAALAAGRPFDVDVVRQDFPVLGEMVNGNRLIWLDNAATTQKPQSVIDRLAWFYAHENSNIHRAAHELAARATDAYEGARETVRGFINAGSVNEVVFVRGTTEAINLVAQSWGRTNIKAGDEIILTWLEHHANIVPWQRLAAETGAVLRVVPVDDDGRVLLEEYTAMLGPRTKLVSFTQVSNALGTVTPAQEMVAMAHAAGARVLVDGAQSVSHMRTDVSMLDADWFVFSGHKIFGPTGIGVLYGKEDLLNEMPPWQGGGNMIKDVTFERTTYQNAPGRFEAGTGNIADAAGLGAAIDYVNSIGIDVIAGYEHELLVYATGLLNGVPGLRLIGTAPDKAAVLSFVMEGHSNEEIGSALNQAGIAVRAGHHCAQPILRRYGLETTVRPSLAFYNNCADIDALAAVLHRLQG